MVEVLMRRTMGGLAPETESEAVPVLQRIAIGTLLAVDVKDTRRRSVRHNAWFFALLNKVWSNQNYFKSVEHLRHALLVRLGYCDETRLKDGRIIYTPHSMAFAKMPREEFEKFAADAVKFLCEEVIPGLPESDLRREVEEMLA